MYFLVASQKFGLFCSSSRDDRKSEKERERKILLLWEKE
jgi:hypothetical protein